MRMRPPISAMVAGSAPAARITASTSRAVRTFCGYGMPCAMMVDSSATSGRPAARAAATGALYVSQLRARSPSMAMLSSVSEALRCAGWGGRYSVSVASKSSSTFAPFGS